MRANRINSRVSKKGVKGTLTGEYLLMLFTEEGSCWYCGNNFKDLKSCHVDHIKPLCKGGTNTHENIRISCDICNCFIKRGMGVEEMFEHIEKLYFVLKDKI